MDPLFTYDPYKFTTDEFAIKAKPCFDDYIEYRIQGMARRESVIRAFNMIAVRADLSNADQLALAIECSRYYRDHFDKRLAAKKASELWNANKAINRLLEIAEDKQQRGPARIAAVKELNIIGGVTVVDEDGNTRAGSSLDDFYKAVADQGAARKAPSLPSGEKPTLQ